MARRAKVRQQRNARQACGRLSPNEQLVRFKHSSRHSPNTKDPEAGRRGSQRLVLQGVRRGILQEMGRPRPRQCNVVIRCQVGNVSGGRLELSRFSCLGPNTARGFEGRRSSCQSACRACIGRRHQKNSAWHEKQPVLSQGDVGYRDQVELGPWNQDPTPSTFDASSGQFL